MASSRFVRRGPLYSGESLPSLLVRLAALNHYRPPSLINRVCLDGLEKDRPDRPVNVDTHERIAALACLDPDIPYTATGHRFAQVLTPPGVEMRSITLAPGQAPLLADGIAAKQLRPASAAQFCPDCLAEAAYHHLAWLPAAVSACPQHKRLLADRCPECGSGLSIRDVVKTRCSNCQFELTQTPTSLLDKNDTGLLAQRLVRFWFGVGEMPAEAAGRLPDQPPAALYRAADGLRLCLASVSPNWPYFAALSAGIGPTSELAKLVSVPQTRLTTAESYRLYTAAINILLDWPHNFFNFLDAWRSRPGASGGSTLYGDFGSLYSQWLEKHWRHPALAFIQEAFDAYLLKRYPASVSVVQSGRYRRALAQKSAWMTEAEAARRLGVSTATVKKLVECGRLAAEVSPGRLNLVSRADVFDLARRWQEGLSLVAAAQRLGISTGVVLDLTRLGLLEAERGPEVEGGQVWLFNRESVEGFRQAVLERIQPGLPDGAAVDLAGAARILSAVGLNAAGTLKLVWDGKLHGCQPAEDHNDTLASLTFTKTDVRHCAKQIIADNGWVRRGEIARRMGVKVTVVSGWVRAGLLAPAVVHGNAQYFGRDEVEAFVTGHVFSDEAAEILGIGVLAVQKWARNGRLTPVSGPGSDGLLRYLFRRENVEQLRPENRLTGPQLARQLGISRSQLWQRIKKGKVTPVSGPEIDGSRHYLFLHPPAS